MKHLWVNSIENKSLSDDYPLHSAIREGNFKEVELLIVSEIELVKKIYMN